MLVLSRKVGERIFVGDDVIISVVRVSGDRVRIGVTAPTEVPVFREEIHPAFRAEEPQHPVGRA